MSREVRHDGVGAFQIRFPFDRELVDLIKTLPNRRWNAAERFWWVPEHDVVSLVDLLHPKHFRFDAATRQVYQEQGGAITLDDTDPAADGALRLPGLFDDQVAGDPAVGPGGSDDYTVSKLNERVKQVIQAAFPQPVWLVGEVSGFNRNAHKRHVGFKLAEHDGGGKTVSSIDAILFEGTRRVIEQRLAAAGEPFRLEDEIKVRLCVRVDLYVDWGSYRVVVEELDVNYTLGEAARRREEIIRRLTEEGLVGLNTSLTFPAVPLRVGLITSLGSDAYNDVLRTLQESRYAFDVVVHGARVQGRATEPSILNALDHFLARSNELDVVLICRGGGSRTDLAWFDSDSLGRAVARFPLPVVIGIGHEQDYSVLDAVGWRRKTPTAAAAFLVDTVRRSLEQVESHCADLLALAARRLHEERRRQSERGRRLALAARALLQKELVRLSHRRERTARAALALLDATKDRLDRWVRDVPRETYVHLTRQRSFLDNARRAMSQGARRDIAAQRQHIDDSARVLAPRAQRVVAREAERTAARERRLRLVDPRRVVERGYAVLRIEGGAVVTDAGMAPRGAAVSAELRRGWLRLRSEGEPAAGEGETGS